jgi:lysophospholipase L1-like esterase
MWSRFVAIGDSFTEGMSDPHPSGNGYRGWADRLAEHMARRNPDLLYANLAIRGRLTARVVDEQVPAALAMQPDLVSYSCGVNDLMRRNFSLDEWRITYEGGLVRLRESGADVLVVAFGDPTGRPGFARSWIPRYEALNRATVEMAHRHGCYLLDFWPRKQLDRDIYWSDDRLHLSTLGHQVTAEVAATILGVPFDSDSHVIAPDRPIPWWYRRVQDAQWAVEHAVPWAVRRAMGKSSGDGITEKRPMLQPVDLSRR